MVCCVGCIAYDQCGDLLQLHYLTCRSSLHVKTRYELVSFLLFRPEHFHSIMFLCLVLECVRLRSVILDIEGFGMVQLSQVALKTGRMHQVSMGVCQAFKTAQI